MAAPAGLEGVLGLGADAYLLEDARGRRGVVAGFHWFGEWGRDTFIALPGLTLARGRVAECGKVLEGALAFLRDGALHPFHRYALTTILNSSEDLLRLINEILDLSRIEAGRYELNEESVSLVGIVEDCHHLLKLRATNVDKKQIPFAQISLFDGNGKPDLLRLDGTALRVRMQ